MPSPLFLAVLNSYHSTSSDTHVHAANLSRKSRKLAITRHFWALDQLQKLSLQQNTGGVITLHPLTESLLSSPDPFDFQDPPDNTIVNRRGIIVRTDFTNDDAWNALCEEVTRSEKDGIESMFPPETSTPTETPVAQDWDAESDGSDSSEDVPTDDQSHELAVFILYDPKPDLRPIFTNASNIKLLRLLTDVTIVATPSTTPSRTVHNPLSDLDGFREEYEGRLIWVYDSQSNADGSLRAVSLGSRSLDNATGDSWRAKGRSIWDLQLNIDAGTMTLDFVHDPIERTRNLQDLDFLP